MAEEKRTPKRKPAPSSPWWNASVDVDTLSDDQRLAHELVVGRRDLMPSVERIMNAGITAKARSAALLAFSHALTNPGDPNRDPRVAITTGEAAPD